MKKLLVRGALLLVALLVALQLVPYGRAHTNPPVTGEPAWDSPRTRELAVRACFDCHSHETKWPWYSHVAPMSWLVQRDVDEGREHLDFSAFDRVRGEAEEAAEAVAEGEMPPWFYLPLHGEARLSPQERRELERGLALTLGGQLGRAQRDERERDDDD